MEAMTHEFYECLCWSFYSFSFGCFLREFAPCPFGRWLGRTGVLCAMVVMIMFGSYSIRQCQILATNSIKLNGKEISHEIRTTQITQTPPEAGRQIFTPSGRIVSYTIAARSAAGDISLPRATGGTRWQLSGRGQRDRRDGSGDSGGDRASRGFGLVPYAEPSLSELK